jgi:ATP-binding protein involved in chromosome partitioning
MASGTLLDSVQSALGTVNDPEIKRPITELGMVRSVDIDDSGTARVEVLLTVAGCPMRDTITREVTAAVSAVDGISDVQVVLDVMSAEQRQQLQANLRGSRNEKEIPFSRPDNLSKIFAIASGKGGVGKSSVTANLGVAMAAQGFKVGIVDADVYGHSIPAMLGVADQRPTQVEDMIMPVPVHGLRVISIGMLKARPDQVVAWRGPMLDRALVQMLSDVYWGDLDVLLIDLPPGTGDMAISIGQHLTNAEVVVVTTPQEAATDVAERAGTIASMLNQRVIGVVENMSYLACPHCGPEHQIELFGSGGGQRVAHTLTKRFGYDVPLLARLPLEESLRVGGDLGRPVALDPASGAAAEGLRDLAATLGGRGRGLAGMQLGLSPASRG